MKIKDTRFEHVYCVDCKHWNKLLNCIENEEGISPSPCCVCFPYNPEDSTERVKRPQYEKNDAEQVSGDIVYVVYFDGEMYKGHSYKKRKCTYITVGGAKQIVTEDSKYLANMMCKENGIEYYDLNKEQKEEWIYKANQRFEIKEFVEKVD